MGTEHPFNPIVTLIDDSSSCSKDEPTFDDGNPLDFNHESFLFIPYSVQTKMQAQALKDSQSQQSKNSKSFRRQPPQILDSASVVSHAYSTVSGLTENSEHHYKKQGQGYGGYRGKGHPYPNSPNRGSNGNGYFRGGMPQPIPIPTGIPMNSQGHPMYPIPLDMNFVPMPHPTNPNGAPIYPYPGMPIYPPPPMGVPVPFPHHPYYHSSVSSSVSSSYGQSSPLSMSPLPPSYLHAASQMPSDKPHHHQPKNDT
jgi:hypothetical protein